MFLLTQNKTWRDYPKYKKRKTTNWCKLSFSKYLLANRAVGVRTKESRHSHYTWPRWLEWIQRAPHRLSHRLVRVWYHLLAFRAFRFEVRLERSDTGLLMKQVVLPWLSSIQMKNERNILQVAHKIAYSIFVWKQ